MTKRILVIGIRIITLTAMMVGLFVNWAPFVRAQGLGCTFTGIIYRDYNANGQPDIREPGQAGIAVTAFSRVGGVVAGPTLTTAAGTYTLTIPAGFPQVRIEYTIGATQTFLRSGPYGPGGSSPTSVTFVDCVAGPATVLDYGVVNPGQYCQPNPKLSTTCYVLGQQSDPINVGRVVLLTMDYTAGTSLPVSANPANYAQPPEDAKATAPRLGTTWGMAYQRTTDNLFLAPMVRRHTGLADTTGTIYRIPNVITAPLNAGATFVWADLDAILGPQADGQPVAGPNPHPLPGDPADPQMLTDGATYDVVGKAGWGDMDMSDDDTTMFAVNLYRRQIFAIPVDRNNPAAPPTAAGISRFPVPTPPGCAVADVRPFALKFSDGLLYVGIVCSAETGPAASFRAYVYTMTPAGAFGAPILQFPLNYNRTCVNGAPGCAGAGSGQAPVFGQAVWRPWVGAFPYAALTTSPPYRDVSYPQPMLTDIEIDGHNMILGLRDRWGDQMGDLRARGPLFDGVANTGLFNVRAGGDILRACPDPITGVLTLENNANCGGIQSSGNLGAFLNQGPGGGEYYFGDTFVASHMETSMGGLVQIPGLPSVATTVFDPIPVNGQIFQAGVRWLYNDDTQGAASPDRVGFPAVTQTFAGNVERAYRIYLTNLAGNPGQTVGGTAGKANGLGDLEALCGPEPIEIGNRVWEDLDRNGQQDPEEVALAGVIVHLYDGPAVAGAPIATAITNAAGEYIFRGLRPGEAGAPGPYVGVVNTFNDINGDGIQQANEATGLIPFHQYTIALDAAANYGGGPLTTYFATLPTTVTTWRDSNGVVTTDPNALVSPTNFSETTLTTGDYGDNDHTYDFGFSKIIPTPTPPGTPPGGGGSCSPTLEKSVNPSFAQPGDTVTWTITINNPCPTAATGLTVSDTIPGSLTITGVSASSGNVTRSGQTVTVTNISVPAHGRATISITTVVNSGSALTIGNTATMNGLSADALLLLARRLPNTGESPFSGAQLPLIVMGIGMAGLAVILLARRRRA